MSNAPNTSDRFSVSSSLGHDTGLSYAISRTLQDDVEDFLFEKDFELVEGLAAEWPDYDDESNSDSILAELYADQFDL